eukprot:6726111-Alexandrium_andersonii.AAC.1
MADLDFIEASPSGGRLRGASNFPTKAGGPSSSRPRGRPACGSQLRTSRTGPPQPGGRVRATRAEPYRPSPRP